VNSELSRCILLKTHKPGKAATKVLYNFAIWNRKVMYNLGRASLTT
jgi:hypothetical protein